MGRIDPLPSEMDLEAWYSTHYRQMYKGSTKPHLRHVLRAARNALERLQWLQGKAPFANPERSSPRTLDIGASSGEFVALMKSLGCEAYGIEPHEGYASFANSLGLNVVNGSLRGALMSMGSQTFELVTMFHVLEHLSDPVGALRLIGQKLSPGGRLYLEVPNATRATSPTYMFFKAHTLYFDQTSLSSLLSTAGYDIVALSGSDEGNLRVVGRFQPAQVSKSVYPSNHALMTAQKERTWGRYLIRQAIQGQPFRKLVASYQEKRAANTYQDAADLLSDIYAREALHEKA
jgi:2-polyprenyl-3-methyl-5-hydroxy-6-metoxy-1,4-benzoquinol methylase